MNPENRPILSSMAFKGFKSRYHAPELNEGFQDITEVTFQVRLLFMSTVSFSIVCTDLVT